MNAPRPPLDSASSVTSTMVQEAVALHLNGRLEQAEALYRQVLDRQQDNFDATHLLGVIAMQTGRWTQAVDLLSLGDAAEFQSPSSAGQFWQCASLRESARRSAPAIRSRIGARSPLCRRTQQSRQCSTDARGVTRRPRNPSRTPGKLAPTFDFALGNGFQSRRHCCDWQDFSLQVADVLEALSAGVASRPAVLVPLRFRIGGDQLECAKSYGHRCVRRHSRALDRRAIHP